MKIFKRVLFYGLAVAIGVFLGFAFSGMSMQTDYYLNGKVVNDKMTSAKFIQENITDMKMRTTVDINKIPRKMLGVKVGFLPVVEYEGKPGSGTTAIYSILFISTLITVLLFFGIHYAYRRMNNRSEMHNENVE